jgi:hypothetical protein
MSITDTFDIDAISREGISSLEVSRIIRDEVGRLLNDLMEPGADLAGEAMQQRISDADWFMGVFSDYLGETLPGPPIDPEDEDEDDGWSYDEDDAHATSNNHPDARPVRLA